MNIRSGVASCRLWRPADDAFLSVWRETVGKITVY